MILYSYKEETPKQENLKVQKEQKTENKLIIQVTESKQEEQKQKEEPITEIEEYKLYIAPPRFIAELFTKEQSITEQL